MKNQIRMCCIWGYSVIVKSYNTLPPPALQKYEPAETTYPPRRHAQSPPSGQHVSDMAVKTWVSTPEWYKCSAAGLYFEYGTLCLTSQMRASNPMFVDAVRRAKACNMCLDKADPDFELWKGGKRPATCTNPARPNNMISRLQC